MSNNLDPDQARRFAGPDLGPNCKGYQQTTKVATSGDREQIKQFPKLFLRFQTEPLEDVLHLYFDWTVLSHRL